MRASEGPDPQTSSVEAKIPFIVLPDNSLYSFINSKNLIEGHLQSSMGCKCSIIYHDYGTESLFYFIIPSKAYKTYYQVLLPHEENIFG